MGQVGLSGLVGRPEPPVLKHGPRSVIWVQVRGCQTFKRSESNRYEPLIPLWWYNTGLGILSQDPLRPSILITTRKIANFTWAG